MIEIPNSRFQISDSKFQIPNSRFQISDSKFQISGNYLLFFDERRRKWGIRKTKNANR